MKKTKFLILVICAVFFLVQCSKDASDKVNNSNGLPIANAGDDQKVVIGSTVKINASSSADPDGDNLTFS